MATIQTLNSYKEYHDAVVAKQFVDRMRKEGINLSAESTLEVISKNPTEYGLTKGTTREDLNNLLSTLNRVSGSKDYNCTYAQIKESKELFQKRRDLQKDAYSHYKDKTYPAEKKANSAIKQTIAKERAKNFFGFFARLGITGAIIAVPAILAATLIGGPIALGIGIGAGIVGLIQHAITRRAVSGRISARNEKITRAKRMLRSEIYGSDKHLAAERKKLYTAENGLYAIMADERGYAKAVESAIAKGLAAENPSASKEGTEIKAPAPEAQAPAPEVSNEAPVNTVTTDDSTPKNSVDNTVPEEPKVEEPKVEKPKAEELKVEEPSKETPAPQEEAQEVTVDDNGQGHFINPEEYEVEVEKKPRTRKPKQPKDYEQGDLFAEAESEQTAEPQVEVEPQNQEPQVEETQPQAEQSSDEDEAPVATPDGVDNVTPVTADEVQKEIEEADDEVDLSQDIDAVATVSSGTRVNLAEIEAEKAKMREAGELAEEPAPVITREEPENQEPAKEAEGMVKKPEESEK